MKNVDHTQELTHLSLCTGYGGIDIGLNRALSGAVRSVAYVEIEAFAISNLVSKIENGHLDTAPIYTDLKRFPWRRFRGRVDILSGGFPCQPFSAAGRRAGDEDPRHLFPYILNGLRELGRPPLVFLENVEGIISSKLKGDGWSDPEGTPVLLHVLRELERVGYDATAGVFSAREVGAPHQRKRVFILACRSDLRESGRALVSGLLERGGGAESGVNMVDPCDNSGRRARALIHSERATVGGRGARVSNERDTPHAHAQHASIGTVYPAPRGAEQHPWEPPRVTMGDADNAGDTPQRYTTDSHGAQSGERQRGLTLPESRRQCSHGRGGNEAQSAMGGDVNGAPRRMGYAELCHALDNRTDELRLLGNGVVPDTAARAFRELWRDLIERG